MELNDSEKGTILRALIIYDKYLPRGLRNKGFFIDRTTFTTDILNIYSIKEKIERELEALFYYFFYSFVYKCLIYWYSY